MTQQLDGSCNVTSDTQLFCKLFKTNLFVSANTNEKHILSEEYCTVRHDDKMYFLLICRYHIKLKVDIRELLQKLDAFCFNYQHVDCLYTLFKYRICGKIVVKCGQLFENV